MRIALEPISYQIACFKGNEAVVGEAIALPPPLNEFRMCVRHDGTEWRIDHYDSGYAIVGPAIDVFEERGSRLAYFRKWKRDGRSKTRVVAWLVRYLLHLRKSKPDQLDKLRGWV